MKNILEKLTGNKLLIFFFIFVIATVFYLFKIGFSDLWSDETYTISMLNGTLSDFYSKFKNDLHPPLYYLGLRLYTGLFGLSTTSLRTFSVIGVLSTLLLGYFAGRHVFGKQGALYLCLMLISVPMLAVYSHQARMYSWAAFSITGVFIYSCLFIRTGTTRNLVLLLIFTVAAVYIHYYSMIAAFMANLFVFLQLVLTKNKKWLNHLISLIVAAILFLPWLFMFIVQLKRVQNAFWAPEVSLPTILSCFTIPFTEQFWTSGYSRILTFLMYAMIVLSILLSFTKSFSEYRLALWLSLFIFLGTLFFATIISLFSQPILYSRYVAVIVTMLIVPVTIILTRMKIKLLKIILIPVILFLGIRISISAYYFSYGPYKQTIEYISATYPEISKILHITEVTAGPMIQYNGNSGLSHYWLKAKMSNVDAFPEIHQYSLPGEFLQPGEEFCVVRFHNLELNQNNLDLVLSESELIKKDTVFDSKFKNGIFIQLYLLKYKDKNMKTHNQECCPEFEAEKWDKKTLNWENKLFLKESIPTFFHIPFPPMIGKKVMKMHSLAQKSEATIPDKSEVLILFRDPSAFKSEIYYSATKRVEGANNTTISGSFVAGVFDGPYNSIPKYIKEMENYLKEKDQIARDYYVHYAYCPKCAKESGHNYMILFALV